MGEAPRSAGSTSPLEHVRRFDDRRLLTQETSWPVEVPPFEDGRFHSPKHRALQLLMKAAQGTALRLPGPLQRGLVASLAGAGRALDKRHTRAAEDYIRAALPLATDPEVDLLVAQAWRHLLRIALVAVGVDRHVMGGRLGDHYEIKACPEALDVLERPGGAIMLSAHVGFWEACCPAIVGMGWGPVLRRRQGAAERLRGPRPRAREGEPGDARDPPTWGHGGRAGGRPRGGLRGDVAGPPPAEEADLRAVLRAAGGL